jgi:hypothetical protein
MIDVAKELREEIGASAPRLRALTEADATRDRGTGKWVRKEILGHLIDSAANNHQRFVRARFGDPFQWPGYDQNAWVSAHAYRSRSWTELLDLWVALNQQIAHAIESIPPASLATRCVIGDDEPVTLDWLIRDYVRHFRHHLAQILTQP